MSKTHSSAPSTALTPQDYLKKTLNARVYDVAIVTPLQIAKNLSQRLDNTVLEYFRAVVERAGGGNYQSLINEALLAHIHQLSMLEAVRQVVKEELSGARDRRGLAADSTATARKRAAG